MIFTYLKNVACFGTRFFIKFWIDFASIVKISMEFFAIFVLTRDIQIILYEEKALHFHNRL